MTGSRYALVVSNPQSGLVHVQSRSVYAITARPVAIKETSRTHLALCSAIVSIRPKNLSRKPNLAHIAEHTQ